jgi:hypothetical protein
MKRPRKQLRPKGPQEFRWNVEMAAREFNMSRATMLRKLTASGWSNGNGDKPLPLLTSHIVKALYPDDGRQHYELLKARADQRKMETAAVRSEFIPVKEIKLLEQVIYSAIAGEINSAAELTADQKRTLVRKLKKP